MSNSRRFKQRARKLANELGISYTQAADIVRSEISISASNGDSKKAFDAIRDDSELAANMKRFSLGQNWMKDVHIENLPSQTISKDEYVSLLEGRDATPNIVIRGEDDTDLCNLILNSSATLMLSPQFAQRRLQTRFNTLREAGLEKALPDTPNVIVRVTGMTKFDDLCACIDIALMGRAAKMSLMYVAKQSLVTADELPSVIAQQSYRLVSEIEDNVK